MALLTPPRQTVRPSSAEQQRPTVRQRLAARQRFTNRYGLGGPQRPEGLNRRGSLEPKDPHGPKRSTLVALVLACATLVTLDQTPALDPVRGALGDVFGPAESAVATLARPVTSIPSWFEGRDKLRGELADAQATNKQLRSRLRTTADDRRRLAQYDGLTAAAEGLGYSLVPARVTAYGPAQSFSRTVTIDAGSAAGIAPDMTVVDADGLVGRVLRVSAHTATVLLIVDSDSVVGGRVGDSGQVGMVSGTGTLGKGTRLDLDLIDQTAAPIAGETVVTWGDGRGAPYVSGVPIGRVTGVFASVQDSSRTVRVQPYVDFGSLDVVGVVVPAGTGSDRAVIGPDGKLR